MVARARGGVRGGVDCGDLIEPLAPAVARKLLAALEEPAVPTSPELRSAVKQAHRMLAYLSDGATRTSDPSAGASESVGVSGNGNPGVSDEDRDRRRRRVGPGRGVPAAPRSRGDGVRVRPSTPAGTPTPIRVDTADETLYVDSGFIVFNDRNYPRFERLLARLGVVSQPSVMSFSVSDGTGDFEYSSGSPNGLFAKRAHLVTPWFHRMVADLARFNHQARRLLERQDSDISLGEWLERHAFSRPFVERLIVPQVSAVWSADPNQRW